jgi:hypothetical protein
MFPYVIIQTGCSSELLYSVDCLIPCVHRDYHGVTGRYILCNGPLVLSCINRPACDFLKRKFMLKRILKLEENNYFALVFTELSTKETIFEIV